jgi:hypothetical protein
MSLNNSIRLCTHIKVNESLADRPPSAAKFSATSISA